ncbi:MAG: hypothetical protein JWN99_1251 [Ilumatobacteraceae bacterium]|nr:hypothetical protein [Ilumatobacteraceae bacterium]
MTDTWEYRIDEIRLSDKWSTKRHHEELERFRSEFNDLGARRWELVSYQAIPMTGSIVSTNINGYASLAIFKRVALPPPEDRSAAWKADPSGRALNRYWDGYRWTPHVSHADGSTADDW